MSPVSPVLAAKINKTKAQGLQNDANKSGQQQTLAQRLKGPRGKQLKSCYV